MWLEELLGMNDRLVPRDSAVSRLSVPHPHEERTFITYESAV